MACFIVDVFFAVAKPSQGKYNFEYGFFFSSGDCCIIHLALNKSGDNTPQSKRKMNFACKLHLPQFQGRTFARQTTPSSVLFRPRFLSFKSWLTLKVSCDNHIWYKAADICGISRRVMIVHFDQSVFRFTPLSNCCLVQKLVKNCLCKNLSEKFDLWLPNMLRSGWKKI